MFKLGRQYQQSSNSALEGIWRYVRRNTFVYEFELQVPKGNNLFRSGQLWYVDNNNWEKWIEFKPITKKTYHPEFF
jgi:hypothetical protein